MSQGNVLNFLVVLQTVFEFFWTESFKTAEIFLFTPKLDFTEHKYTFINDSLILTTPLIWSKEKFIHEKLCYLTKRYDDTKKQYFKAIFILISKFDLNLDSVGDSTSKWANKGNSI